jgi:hypothetical protein
MEAAEKQAQKYLIYYETNFDHEEVKKKLWNDQLLNRVDHSIDGISKDDVQLMIEKRTGQHKGEEENFVSEKNIVILRNIPLCPSVVAEILPNSKMFLSFVDEKAKDLAFEFLRNLPHKEGENETVLKPVWQTPYKIPHGADCINLFWCPEVTSYLSTNKVLEVVDEQLDRVKSINTGMDEIMNLTRSGNFSLAQEKALKWYDSLPQAFRKRLAHRFNDQTLKKLPRIDWLNGLIFEWWRLRNSPAS